MSFSSSLKKELCNIVPSSNYDIQSELYGLALFQRGFYSDIPSISSENINVIYRIIFLIKNIISITYDLDISFDKSRSLYFVNIGNEEIKEYILNLSETIIMQHPVSFLRGVFLACGTVTNPNSGYHLEFDIFRGSLANKLIYYMGEIKNTSLSPHSAKRKNNFIVYLKSNEQITDFLAFIGASKCAMDFIQIKMIKEFRNYVNRTTNFETANISKITAASLNQINAIKYIKSKKGMNWLPETLKETAYLRIKNPYMSLDELRSKFSEPLTKSGLNHRLKKIISISESLDKQD